MSDLVRVPAMIFFCQALVWLLAWVWNPEFTSGTIWFLGALVGLIVTAPSIWDTSDES